MEVQVRAELWFTEQDAMVSCAGLRIKENKEVYEGEVTELSPEETQTGVSSDTIAGGESAIVLAATCNRLQRNS